MKVAILGTGMVGRSIAIKLAELGHEVSLGTRNVENTLSKGEPDEYGNPPFKDWYSGQQSITLKSFKEACATAELIFNCTNGQASIPALEMVGEEILDGKVLIDVANPLDFSEGMPPSLSPTNTDSLGETIQRRFPKMKVVKSLNTMNAYLMVNPSLIKDDHTVFVCGNDAEAKTLTKEVLKSFGWAEKNIIDLGDISSARGTEMILPIWLRLWQTLGTAEFNFHIQRNL